jgi:hypothetical protein
MRRALDRMRALFVEPLPDRWAGSAPPPPQAFPCSVAVLCPAHQARVAAGAVALALARRQRSGWAVAVVPARAVERVGTGASAIALPAAARAAAGLRRQRLSARAHGRLVWIERDTLPNPELVETLASAVEAPLALAIPLPRSAPGDATGLACDATVLVGERAVSPAIASLAVTELERSGAVVSVLASAPTGVVALLVRAGLLAPASLHAAVAALGSAG